MGLIEVAALGQDLQLNSFAIRLRGEDVSRRQWTAGFADQHRDLTGAGFDPPRVPDPNRHHGNHKEPEDAIPRNFGPVGYTGPSCSRHAGGDGGGWGAWGWANSLFMVRPPFRFKLKVSRPSFKPNRSHLGDYPPIESARAQVGVSSPVGWRNTPRTGRLEPARRAPLANQSTTAIPNAFDRQRPEGTEPIPELVLVGM